ncbi:divergent PAP2 family protein [Antarcticirhabdus aurantiaca]|uniref:Divergent PAP2 family protein n=1 Tax=Antarcticirhabdus aurantiaca TaxID=2606717 RepID=A0ACD4NRG6_9HYPH|nr:divergent PAP2 family protein [Antarcticirhabdus aurantiaca]WAJ29240.1 divergent PAP2 family protein [Jeongeuplla avenae]
MDLAYPLAPLLGYLAAGSLKFAINSVADRSAAFGRIGLGGAVSTHTTIVATTFWLIGLKEGFGTPAFSVALTLAVIVIIDAMDLRQRIGRHVGHFKRLHPEDAEIARLRERMGHKPQEVAAGLALGLVLAAFLSLI